MTTINPEDALLTLINTFDVDPDKQEALIESLRDTTDRVMCKFDGFVSANLHKSLDGCQVANYVQWRSKTHMEAMMSDPKARALMAESAQIANKITPIIYHAVYSKEAIRV
ncbi:hypothetical protein TW85_06345 [Marinomonas sp. S3726]|uniref:antibiotic biosynthesis monooxygenase family protein n=1 Tax=Marinomonas sp. S3726 TaxID=579484 RepID=UPI0005FA152F|nr:antibiotic biosynthesis monooxygenase [Marinomonas sp. S3726]KJZ15201.1 hypothetical protein TW85_06345 [Marinomonas sp. S3726]